MLFCHKYATQGILFFVHVIHSRYRKLRDKQSVEPGPGCSKPMMSFVKFFLTVIPHIELDMGNLRNPGRDISFPIFIRKEIEQEN